MKKTLSLILAVMMLLGCMSITAFAAENDKTGTTTLTATKAEPFSYKISIPTNVDPITAAGVYEVGQAKAIDVNGDTANTVIFYTVTTTDFKCNGKTDLPATYYTEQAATNAFPTTAVTVYENKADAASIPTMYVKIADSDWNAAAAGTYTATVTFNFEAKEKMTIEQLFNTLEDGKKPTNSNKWTGTMTINNTNLDCTGYIEGDNLIAKPQSGDDFYVPMTLLCNPIENDQYKSKISIDYDAVFTFTMQNEKLSSLDVEVSGASLNVTIHFNVPN